MLVCCKQVSLQCHSLPHPNAHLCHYQNKETFDLSEMAINASGNDQEFLPEMSAAL
jgi:hypothetical protein